MVSVIASQMTGAPFWDREYLEANQQVPTEFVP